MVRRLVRSLVVLLVLVLLALAVGGWYYTRELLPALAPEPPGEDVEVVAVDGDRVTLRPTAEAPASDVEDLTGPALVGLHHPGGYLQLSGASAAGGDGAVIRSFEVVSGTTPAPGDRGDVQVAAYPDQPTALGLPVEQVTAPGPLGELPGWQFPGEGPAADRWVVLVHGRGARRSEALRAVETVTGRLGHSSLVVSYRNDPGAPPSPDGFGHYGDAEWQDLQAWLSWLDDVADPTQVVLYGFSQGASIVAGCLRWCTDTPAVAGAVLDSPLLSMHQTLELQAAGRGIPDLAIDPLLVATKLVATLRGGPDFARLEHVDALVELDLPILAFHGRQDTTVPFAPTAELARRDPQEVTLLPHDGGHVRGWNLQRDDYTAQVVDYLGTLP